MQINCDKVRYSTQKSGQRKQRTGLGTVSQSFFLHK